MVVDVEIQERYWYPDDGGEVWVAGYYPVDAAGRFLGARRAGGRGPDRRPRRGRGRTARRPWPPTTPRPAAPLTLRAEPDNPHDPHAVAVLLASGEPVGYVPRDIAPRIDDGWSAIVLRERRDTPRDPRNGPDDAARPRRPIELRVT